MSFNILGYFCNKYFCPEFPKIAQSGHTDAKVYTRSSTPRRRHRRRSRRRRRVAADGWMGVVSFIFIL